MHEEILEELVWKILKAIIVIAVVLFGAGLLIGSFI